MFEFNHVDPSQKHSDYTNLIRRVISSEQLDEVDKCILLCPNCHRIIHAQGISGHVQLTVNIAGQSATQTLKGQTIIDREERRINFLSNERILVIPYLLEVGGQEPQLIFGTQLEEILVRHFRNLPQIKRLRVMAYQSSRVLMDTQYVKENRMKMKFDLGFPVFTTEFFCGSNDAPFIWIRNGVGLTKDGDVLLNRTVNCEGELCDV